MSNRLYHPNGSLIQGPNKKKLKKTATNRIYFITGISQLTEVHDLCKFCYPSEEDVKEAIATIQSEDKSYEASELKYNSMELVSFT